MFNKTRISIAALMVASALSAPAMAQSVSGGANVGSDTSATTGGAVDSATSNSTSVSGGAAVNGDGTVNANASTSTSTSTNVDGTANATATTNTSTGANGAVNTDGAGVNAATGGTTFTTTDGTTLTAQGECQRSDASALDFGAMSMATAEQIASAETITLVEVDDCIITDNPQSADVAANAKLMEELSARGVAAGDILTVETNGENSIIVYAQSGS